MLHDQLRLEARLAPESGIVAVANRARLKQGLIPMWAGEGDLPTPSFIADAAAKALADGETFYTWQRGIPPLREALARYHERHFGKTFHPDEFVVCGSGMQAIQLAINATCGAGGEAIYLTPAWPNFAGAAGVAGATPVGVPLDHSGNGWSCDPAKIEAAISGRTKVIFVNTPANPTGWTADHDTLKAILAIARRHDLWIIADEIYAHFHYDGGRAPSFMDIVDPDEKIIYVNSFSKNWAMTGWRMGWVKIHADLKQVFENLVQYSTSGVSQFLQKGAIAALDEGDDFIRMQVERAHKARDLVCRKLRDTGRARFTAPQGAFYLMFSVDGVTDTREAAFDIVENANVGIAPGTAFGQGGEGFFRLCFHRRLDQVEEGADRIARWIINR